MLPDLYRLKRDVERLSVVRHPIAAPRALEQAEDFIALELGATGLRVERQLFEWRGREFHNVVATNDGSDRSRPWVVVGAHFDSTPHTPGADDNASAVAAMLEVARLLAGWRPAATIQFVGFNLEEVQTWTPPIYRIGSRAYARRLKAQGRKLEGALVLEMVGYTGPVQRAPFGLRAFKKIPRTGDFLAAVGDGNSRELLRVMERSCDGVVELVSLAVPLKGFIMPDTRRSDNARFWDEGYPALMVTDTADLRNPHYHLPSDRPETLDYEFAGKTVTAVAKAVMALAG